MTSKSTGLSVRVTCSGTPSNSASSAISAHCWPTTKPVSATAKMTKGKIASISE